MKAPRILSRRESEVARLAAQRTKDDAIAIILRAARIWKENGGGGAAALECVAEIIGEHVRTDRVVTEL